MSPRLVIALSVALCCSCSGSRPIDPAAQDQNIFERYGRPDLISENAGEISRHYLPGTVFRGEAWPFAEKSYYFLQRREKIVVPHEGAREVRRLTDAEAADVAGMVRRLQQLRTQPLATSRASPDQ